MGKKPNVKVFDPSEDDCVDLDQCQSRFWLVFSSPQEVFEVPRYFFHVKRGQMTVLDQEGIELADAAQAEEEAVRRAQQYLADDALGGMPVSRVINSGMIIVADENWGRLFELPF